MTWSRPARDTDADRVVLDMLAPWEVLDVMAAAMTPGGVLCAYVATTTQLSRDRRGAPRARRLRRAAAWESMVRGWHVDGLAVRPEHRMIGHTGFLVTARRLAPGVTAPPKRRRPAKGARPERALKAGYPGVDARCGYRLTDTGDANGFEEVPVPASEEAEARAARLGARSAGPRQPARLSGRRSRHPASPARRLAAPGPRPRRAAVRGAGQPRRREQPERAAGLDTA